MKNSTSAPLWQIDKQRLLVILIGGVIYGGLVWLEYFMPFPSVSSFSLKPSVAIPVFCGLIWGPVAGFGVGALGLLLADLLTPGQAFPLAWFLGHGMLGLLPGLVMPVLRDRRDWVAYLLIELAALASVYISLDFLTALQKGVVAGAVAGPTIFSPAFISYGVSALIIVPILYWGYHRFR